MRCPRADTHQPHAVYGGTLLTCRACGLVYWPQRWDAQQAQVHYDGYYRHEPITYDPLTERRYHEVLQSLERLGPKGAMLDVGCGAGHLLAVAAARGWEAVGIEVSQSALQTVGQLKRAAGPRFRVLQGTLEECELAPGSLRLVTMIEVLEHLADPLETLRRVSALLAPGGLLYLTTPNYHSLSRRLLGPRWRVIAPEHQSLFTAASVRRYLRASGLRLMRLRTKNLDLTELLAKWRRREGAPPQHGAARQQAQALRHALEQGARPRLAKRIVNLLLGATGAGDTIETLAMAPR